MRKNHFVGTDTLNKEEVCTITRITAMHTQTSIKELYTTHCHRSFLVVRQRVTITTIPFVLSHNYGKCFWLVVFT